MKDVQEITRNSFSPLCNDLIVLLDGSDISCPAKLGDEFVPILLDHESHELLRRIDQYRFAARRDRDGRVKGSRR